MDLLVTPFSNNSFMLQALTAGILVSIACAIAGTFVILRGLAFIGDALAHGVLPGIAVAVLAGFPGIIGAAIGAAFMIGGITLITSVRGYPLILLSGFYSLECFHWVS